MIPEMLIHTSKGINTCKGKVKLDKYMILDLKICFGARSCGRWDEHEKMVKMVKMVEMVEVELAFFLPTMSERMPKVITPNTMAMKYIVWGKHMKNLLQLIQKHKPGDFKL